MDLLVASLATQRCSGGATLPCLNGGAALCAKGYLMRNPRRCGRPRVAYPLLAEYHSHAWSALPSMGNACGTCLPETTAGSPPRTVAAFVPRCAPQGVAARPARPA